MITRYTSKTKKHPVDPGKADGLCSSMMLAVPTRDRSVARSSQKTRFPSKKVSISHVAAEVVLFRFFFLCLTRQSPAFAREEAIEGGVQPA